MKIRAIAALLLIAFVQRGSFQDEQEPCRLGVECVSDLVQKDCPKGYYLKEKAVVEGCCPKCEELGEVPDFCGLPGYDCPFGMYCNDNGMCVLDTKSCFSWLHADPKPKYPPNCNADGTYAAVQCKGDTIIGRCFCSDDEGKRIFGIAWSRDAKDMTCACSRRRSQLEKEGRTDVSLHCDANGNYEKLQCDSELCWCVNPKTGDPVSVALIGDLASQLPCYDEDTYGSQYLRVCESKSQAIAVMKNLLTLHGTTQVTMESVFCDFDGSYGVYQIEKGVAYCSWKDGSRLGAWATQADSNLKYMNCNCARDTKYFELDGKTMTQQCSGNGNYEKNQQINGQQYCVDSDGYPTTDIVDSGEELTCPS